MYKVRFDSEEQELLVGESETFLTIYEKYDSPLMFGCMEGNCGTCKIRVLENYKNHKFNDFQGSHWAPHLIHKDLWIKIGGFSEEFNPGIGSDPDLNMKLWKERVRIFKGIGNFRVYHFGSISLRKKSNIKKNNGTKTFLKKWGITPKFFKKHYLKSDTSFDGPLAEPVYNLNYFIGLFICKVKLFFTI